MNYTSIIILIVLSLVFMASARSPPYCGKGGRHVQCASACDTSCQTLDRPKNLPILCATACFPGCKCDKGFVKTRHGGTCVPIRECRNRG